MSFSNYEICFLCHADEEEDEDFGWGEDDQDDDNHGPARLSLDSTAPVAAGGAIGAMAPSPTPQKEGGMEEGEDAAVVDTPVFGQVGQGRTCQVEAPASAAAAAEIAHLAETLRVCEAERARLAAVVAKAGEGVAGNDDHSRRGVEELTRERDAAAAEVWYGVVLCFVCVGLWSFRLCVLDYRVRKCGSEWKHLGSCFDEALQLGAYCSKLADVFWLSRYLGG